ncbi:hypothetical protein JIN85_06150 [Luteolibacter pohnpeiensis]|uniref:ATPase n=1 Tax=Luteolibacter pohnpeiensis TaxID=454153 RepID=A0A934SAY1_9BACT|nr:hypothetical protein [Luteolibacter pohnpeiensis]
MRLSTDDAEGHPLILDFVAFLLGTGAAALLVWEIGWPLTSGDRKIATIISLVLAVAVVVMELYRLITIREERKKWRRAIIFIVVPVFAIIQIYLSRRWGFWHQQEEFAVRGVGLTLLTASQLTLVVPGLLRLLDLTRSEWFKKIPPGMLVVGSFVVVILIGTGLLKTPNATNTGISWLDALFTSTSAVCVTGLIVKDTALDFTLAGQGIILGLIQVGGLGVMTLAYFIALMSGQGISLRDRVFLNEMFSTTNVRAVTHFVRTIVLTTLLIEGIGAAGLYYQWRDLEHGLWHASFHSISAFCNAGFSTFSTGLMDSAARESYGIQSIIMILIIVGGLGFVVTGQLPGLTFAPVLRKITSMMRRRRPYVWVPVHSKLVLVTTALLVVFGMLGFWLLEFEGGYGHPWVALFNSVTARTAGFNVSDLSQLSIPSVIFMCFLMVIGGSPGGTAGGLKTTTFALGMLELRRILLGRSDVNVFGRRISRDVLDRCHVTLVLSLLWILASTTAVSLANPEFKLDDVLFECVSAFATVGVSRGITADLVPFSKCVIILTMLVGRIGILTFALTMAGRPRPRHFQYPEARLPLN